ncbi:MAG: RidA family protein [Syntrophales bacterium]
MKNTSERKIIDTPNAPAAIGPYAQAILYGKLLFVSGMIPIDSKTGELLTGDFEAEVMLVLENLKAVVEAGGMSLKNVLKVSVFLKDLSLFGKFNEIYGRYFGDVLPARETIQVAKLPRDTSIEISAICGK